MAFAYAAGVITQTGTDTSLSGLNGLTGVTRTMSDLDAGASNKFTLWTINSATQLRVQGTLTWDPDQETLLMEKTPSNVNTSAPLYINGGTINYGVTRTSGGRTIYSKSCGLQFTKQGTNFFQYWALYADTTSTFVWNGGVIRSAATLMFDDGATLTINRGTFFSSHPTDAVQIRCQPSNTTNSNKINVYDLTLDGSVNSSRLFTTYNFGTAVFTMHRADFQRYNNVASVPNTLLNLNNASNINTYDVEMSQTSVDRVKTTTVQNSAAVVVTGGAAARYGYVEVYRQLACPVVNLSGSGITYSYYGKDTNNGSRVASPSTTDPQNKTADQVYSGANVSGNLTNNLLIQTAANTNGVVTSDLRWDANGEIQIKIIGYTTGINIFKPVLIGLGSNTEKAIMVPDQLISQSTKATVDAYTGYETPQKAYDGAKALLCDGYAGQTSVYINRTGSQLDFTNSLATAIVFNSAAGSKISFASNTITYRHASDYTGGCTGTGSFTISGAQGLSGGTFNNSGGVVYSSSKTSISGITVTGTLNITVAGTYTLTNCTIGTVVNSSGGSVTIRAINSTITTNSGPNTSIEYYSQITHTIKDGATPKSGALVAYFDGTNANRTYNASFSNTALTSDGSGNVTGYVRYRLNGTTYSGIEVHVGLSAYRKLQIPKTLTGAPLVEDLLLSSDAFYTATPSTGTTINFGTSTITQAGSATTQGVYDYYKQQWLGNVANLFYAQFLFGAGSSFALTGNFALSSGMLSGNALTADSGSTITCTGGTFDGTVNAGTGGLVIVNNLACLPGNINFQGGTLRVVDLTAQQLTGSFASGTIDLDSLSAPTTTQLDLRATSDLGAGLTVKNDSNVNITVRKLPSQTSPTLNTTGPGTGTLTIDDSVPVTHATLMQDSYVRLYNVTQNHELDLRTLSGTGYAYDVQIGTGAGLANAGDTLRLDVALYRTSGAIYLPFRASGVLGDTGLVFSGDEEVWVILQDIHAKGTAYYGQNITGFSLDIPNVQVDSSLDTIDGWKLATWLYYQVATTPGGMRNYFKAFSSLNLYNFEVASSLVDLKVDNTGLPATWINASWTRSDGASIVADTSATIQFSNGLINVVVTDNAGIAAIKAKTDNLPADPASQTQVNTRLASSSYVAPPSAATTATAVRSELTTELARIDATISSRNATAPDNASIAAIKAKTDSLTFSAAGSVDANVKRVNGVEVAGTGAAGDEWGPA